jgi:hypothetical protein
MGCGRAGSSDRGCAATEQGATRVGEGRNTCAPTLRRICAALPSFRCLLSLRTPLAPQPLFLLAGQASDRAGFGKDWSRGYAGECDRPFQSGPSLADRYSLDCRRCGECRSRLPIFGKATPRPCRRGPKAKPCDSPSRLRPSGEAGRSPILKPPSSVDAGAQPLCVLPPITSGVLL